MSDNDLKNDIERLLQAYRNKTETAKTLDEEFLRGWDALKSEILDVFSQAKEILSRSQDFAVTLSTSADIAAYLILKIVSDDGRSGQIEFKPDVANRRIIRTVKITQDEARDDLRLQETSRSTIETHLQSFLRKLLGV